MNYRHCLNQPPRHVAKDHVVDLLKIVLTQQPFISMTRFMNTL